MKEFNFSANGPEGSRLMVGYWAGELPRISRLHFQSFRQFQKGWTYRLFIEEISGIRQSDEELRDIVGDDIEIVRFSLSAMLSDLDLPRIRSGKDTRLARLGYKVDRFLMSRFHSATNGIFSSQQRKNGGPRSGWHPKFGYSPGHTLQSSQMEQNLTLRSDLFRCLIFLKFPNTDICYSDLDICFTRSFPDIFEDSPFAYRWEDFANNALLFVPAHASKVREKLSAALERGCSPRPWIMFTNSRCKSMGLQIMPLELFDPAWTAGSWGGSEPNAFFEKRRFSSEFAREVLSRNYCVHWHNHWSSEAEEGSTYRILENHFSEGKDV